MRQMFPGHFGPTEQELTSLWSEGIVVLDTNVLLNLYRYSERSRAELFTAMQAVRERLWIPHQVASEMLLQRGAVIDAMHAPYDEIMDELSALSTKLQAKFELYGRFGLAGDPQIMSALDQAIRPIRDHIGRERESHLGDREVTFVNDSLLRDIADLFEGRVGEPYSAEQLDAIYAEGASRYEKKIPPGFKDAAKKGPERYGDLVLWLQTLERARRDNAGVVFVTDDQKDDWWFRETGQTFGPRPELVQELREASGGRLHLLRPASFIRWVASRTGKLVAETSLDEIEATSSESFKRERIARLLRKRHVDAAARLEAAQNALILSERAIDSERDIVVSEEQVTMAQELSGELADSRVALEMALAKLRDIDMVELAADERSLLMANFHGLDNALAENKRRQREAQSILSRDSSQASHFANGRLDRHQRLAGQHRRRIVAAQAELAEIDIALRDLGEL